MVKSENYDVVVLGTGNARTDVASVTREAGKFVAFCVFDADRKLVAFNQKYVDLHDLLPGFVHIGMDHEELKRHDAKYGLLGGGDGNIEARVQQRLDSSKKGGARTNELTLPDGTHFVITLFPAEELFIANEY